MALEIIAKIKNISNSRNEQTNERRVVRVIEKAENKEKQTEAEDRMRQNPSDISREEKGYDAGKKYPESSAMLL